MDIIAGSQLTTATYCCLQGSGLPTTHMPASQKSSLLVSTLPTARFGANLFKSSSIISQADALQSSSFICCTGLTLLRKTQSHLGSPPLQFEF